MHILILKVRMFSFIIGCLKEIKQITKVKHFRHIRNPREEQYHHSNLQQLIREPFQIFIQVL